MIEVFYIAYLKKDKQWGFPAFTRFLKSYENYPAGIEHRLTVLLRGYENNTEDYNKIKEICKEKNIKTLDTEDVGLDFGAYLEGAKQSNAQYICCLNTTCEIMCEDWLKKLYSPIEKEKKYAFVGVSGSWELCPNYVRNNRSSKTLKETISNLINKINLPRIGYKFLFMKMYKDFPNYSVRTASFLINKDLLIDYFKIFPLPETKQEAYKTENGKISISKFILEKNFDFCVVNKLGKIFEKQDFDKSGTYRSEEKNYIIKDRQQREYENADFFSKIYLKRICWGKF